MHRVASKLLRAGRSNAPASKSEDTDDGTCDADCSLREAIDAANANPGAGDVPVPAGRYRLTLGSLGVPDDVEIAGAAQETMIIDGNATDIVGAVLSDLVRKEIPALVNSQVRAAPRCEALTAREHVT